MNDIGLDLTRAEVRGQPFRHAVFPPGALLDMETVDDLLRTFPTEMLRGATRRDGDKTYAVRVLGLYGNGRLAPEAAELHPVWRSLVDQLTAAEYRRRIAELLDIRKARIDIELRLTEYTAGGWMSRHTDRADKAFSQNIYLCPDWTATWGGGLALYASRTAAAPTSVFVPGAGNSLAFARSDTSWHEVHPISPRAGAPRRALLIHGLWE